MIDKKYILAVIPARGGSKGLPRKNILALAEKPLIAWSIEAAKGSKYIDRLILSSEDKTIIKIARDYGCEVPFIRPANLATDQASTINVLKHAMENITGKYHLLVLLQPTSPLRISKDIDNAIELLIKKKANSVISVVKTDHPPDWSAPLNNDMNMKYFVEKTILGKRRQDYPDFYRINGAVYVVEIAFFLRSMSFFGEGTYAYKMPKSRSIDIDSLIDFKIAEVLIN